MLIVTIKMVFLRYLAGEKSHNIFFLNQTLLNPDIIVRSTTGNSEGKGMPRERISKEN